MRPTGPYYSFSSLMSSMESVTFFNHFPQKRQGRKNPLSFDSQLCCIFQHICPFNGKEKDYESGFHYYGARYHWSELLNGWLSVDPMADKYPNMSPYAYCAWNPVKLVDPDGREASTHIDCDGNVVAVFRDGDYGVYQHSGTTQQAKEEANNKHSSCMPSAGGLKVGETWTQLGFCDFEKYQATGEIVPGAGARIELSSNWAEQKIEQAMNSSPSIGEYMEKAGNENGDFNIKNQAPGRNVYYGSKAYGKYVSARDAGNILAGRFAKSCIVPTSIIKYGYGRFNESGNNFSKFAGQCLQDLLGCSINPLLMPIMLSYHGNYGENRCSQDGINAGIRIQRMIDNRKL